MVLAALLLYGIYVLLIYVRRGPATPTSGGQHRMNRSRDADTEFEQQFQSPTTSGVCMYVSVFVLCLTLPNFVVPSTAFDRLYRTPTASSAGAIL